jgi:hypothetical protein
MYLAASPPLGHCLIHEPFGIIRIPIFVPIVKGTVSWDGYIFEELNISISIFCADVFQVLLMAFHGTTVPYTITNFLFASLKLLTNVENADWNLHLKPFSVIGKFSSTHSWASSFSNLAASSSNPYMYKSKNSNFVWGWCSDGNSSWCESMHWCCGCLNSGVLELAALMLWVQQLWRCRSIISLNVVGGTLTVGLYSPVMVWRAFNCLPPDHQHKPLWKPHSNRTFIYMFNVRERSCFRYISYLVWSIIHFTWA